MTRVLFSARDLEEGELERMLRHCRALSLKVSDETWSALRRHFSVRETMDVVMAVAWYNAVARILLPMEIEMEDWYKKGSRLTQ